ncbi:MAG: hypothetical protein WCL11_04360 [Verrucomicrobiota bacterium]|nr:hypothetical protein [Verrucomicrobiota bacterium]
MMKKFLPVLFLPLLLAGCATAFTNLTPLQQARNPKNLYPVEVALDCSQQTLRWESIRPQILVGKNTYPMRSTLLMTNRWEGMVPVPPGTESVTYRYKFDYDCNSFGKPKPASRISREYTLSVKGQ